MRTNWYPLRLTKELILREEIAAMNSSYCRTWSFSLISWRQHYQQNTASGSATIQLTNGNPERSTGYPTAGLLNHFVFVTLSTQHIFFPTHIRTILLALKTRLPQQENCTSQLQPRGRGWRRGKKCYGIWASVEVGHMVDKERAAGRRAVEKE